MMTAPRPTRWGIISAGLISHDFVCALKGDPEKNHVISAIAARSLDRAQKFAHEHGIRRSYGSYKELSEDPDIDVVYVGNIPACHLDVITMLLRADKPVLSEKPACITHRQATEIVSLARERRVLFVEGMWSRFFPAYGKIREALESGVVGEPQIINFFMGFDYLNTDWVHEVDWRMDPKSGGGIGLAFGVYAISLAEWVFRDKPMEIVATGQMASTGCDTTCTFVLDYPGDRRLVCTVSSTCNLECRAVVCCKKGMIEVPMPFCPIRVKVKDDWFDFPLPKSDVKFNYFNCMGFLYEADHVRNLLREGLIESPISSHEYTMSTMVIADDIRLKMGVVFNED